jgi:hypothetical protein
MSCKIDTRGQTLALSIDPDSFGTLTPEIQGLLGIKECFLQDPEG